MNQTHYHNSSRRTHRKRFSVSRLSSDTLPEYTSPLGWTKPASHISQDDQLSDRPPDYPDSTEEADADTEDGASQSVLYVPQHFPQPSPRRARRYPARKRQQSTSDPFLDTLLERSVHALEMSNALLQSSMSTQSSLSMLLSPDSVADRSLEVRARNLSTRISGNKGVHESWMDHLEEISKEVDGLFKDDGKANGLTPINEGAVSQSLPTSHMPDLRHRRRPSLLELNGSSSHASQLQFSHPDRNDLVAPAPRALTQYVESTVDPELIILPSTLGLRASSSAHSADWQEASFTASEQNPSSSQSLPLHPEQPSLNQTPAYELLSSFVKRSESSTPPPALSTPRSFTSLVRRGSTSTINTERGSKMSPSPPPLRSVHSPDRCRRGSASRSRSLTPRRTVSPAPRSMTPPIEELSASSDSTTSSDNHPTGYRTVQSLRKILDEHPSSASVDAVPFRDPRRLRAPAFLPVSPPPAPAAGTSTATASISRLYTKGRHSLSARAPSPPARSSLKVPSVPSTPAPSPSTSSLTEMFGSGVARALGSAPPSGVSTPKRISFAELPESYSSSRPEGAPSKFKDKKARSRSKRRGKGKGKAGVDGSDEQDGSGWLTGWLLGGTSGVALGARHEERIEERMSRGWGTRPGFGTMDDWAV
ncbi:hypothetical protein BJ138DRAFT_1139177 [Hygrophoropsis aurantiaca]|uniref:Uncharacterized protein n=1 Tax=Hygrophoropsis aurantiaca TaxID=72124 RepID=A0ACB8AU60_9AGAM|nr:hypothetical protein BJ138DRAFT_1139177 [Hygrophoropsis aurantiaca]